MVYLKLCLIYIFICLNVICAIHVRQFELEVGKSVLSYTTSDIEDIYRVTYNNSKTTLNITAWTNATVERPLLIVIRQEKGLISLQIPNKETSQNVQNVSRILCPAYAEPDANGRSVVYIDIYTSSATNIAYSIQVNYFQSFIITEGANINTLVSPMGPIFFQYQLKSPSSIVKFTSNDRICTTVSVQRMMCPVFDLKHTVDFNGQYQTMTKLAAISVNNENLILKYLYIVMSVHATDKECCEIANCSQSFDRLKNVSIEILPGFEEPSVNLRYATTLSVFLALYLFISICLCFIEPYSEKNLKQAIEEYNRLQSPPPKRICVVTDTTTDLIVPVSAASGEFNYVISKSEARTNTTATTNDESSNVYSAATSTTIDITNRLNSQTEHEIGVPTTDDNSFSSGEYDKVNDYDFYKETVRNKPNINVHDLARKKPKLLERKIMNYPRLILSIATFYVLPVIQLVLMYQTQLTKSGNEDSCYFNFLCMIKFGPLAAFNNVFSNIGYVLLGVMFIIVVKKRAYAHKYMRRKYPHIISNYGIPQHFGLYYTMGIGLIMEGILSAAYHTCPSYSNFQFDTSFMYVIGAISIIKLYQCRHPDIHPSSQKVFLFLALCILLNVVGVFYGKSQRWFMIVYCIMHISFFFCLSVVVYYMRQPKLDASIFRQIRAKYKQRGIFSKPIHVERLIMLLIANLFNCSLALYAAITVPVQFSSHLLNVFLGNFLLYFIMYITNKFINRERFDYVTILNLIVATAAWVAALYYFGIEVKYWEKKPAESREANKDCILFNIYDHHDAWHFLSALSMFMSMVVILTIDDGIINERRETISVF